MRFAWLVVLFAAGCGKLLVDSDAGDAAVDAGDAAAGEGGAPFACGETGHFVDCDPTTEYCQLVKTSKTHAYTCESLPADCTQTASSPYDCGCYQDGDEIFLTICQ